MKFTTQKLEKAVAKLSMCRFFPPDEMARAAIEQLLARICPDQEALTWLVDEFVNHIGEWRGPVELRAILCTRYKPSDGIEADSLLLGYTPRDGETRTLDRHQQLKVDGLADVPKDPEVHRLIVGMVKGLLQ